MYFFKTIVVYTSPVRSSRDFQKAVSTHVMCNIVSAAEGDTGVMDRRYDYHDGSIRLITCFANMRSLYKNLQCLALQVKKLCLIIPHPTVANTYSPVP